LTDTSWPDLTKWTSTFAGPPATTLAAYPLLGMAEMRFMKKPLQATLTTPPLVEYVAVVGDGPVVGGLAGLVGGGLGRVVWGEAGAVVTGACGSEDGGGAAGGFGLLGTGPPPREATVEVVLVGAVGAVGAAGGPDRSSLTTSS